MRASADCSSAVLRAQGELVFGMRRENPEDADVKRGFANLGGGNVRKFGNAGAEVI